MPGQCRVYIRCISGRYEKLDNHDRRYKTTLQHENLVKQHGTGKVPIISDIRLGQVYRRIAIRLRQVQPCQSTVTITPGLAQRILKKYFLDDKDAMVRGWEAVLMLLCMPFALTDLVFPEVRMLHSFNTGSKSTRY
jgi:hypothetical protein